MAQAVLALAFGAAGLGKLLNTAVFAAQMGSGPALVLFIGISELAGALGVVVPAATRIKPGLTPLAALGLATIMLLALGLHVKRGELGAIPVIVPLGALALFVAWGRSRAAPITAR